MPEGPRALVIAPESPYPMAGGGALRTASLIEYLTQRFRVDVVVFRQPEEPEPETAFPRSLGCRVAAIALPPNRRSAVARAWRNLDRLRRAVPPLSDRFAGFGDRLAAVLDAWDAGRYAVSIIEHSWCAPYVSLLGPRSDRTVLDLHNIESELHLGLAAGERWPVSAVLRRFGKIWRRLEREWLPRFDILLATSPEDAARAARIASGSRVTVYPNAIPWVPEADAEREEVVAFSGNLEYLPNQQAVRYFATRIWPLLRARYPRLRWRLIGRNPHAVAGVIGGQQRVECTGPVENAVASLRRAMVAVVPLLAGSGTRFKIVEAWAAGTPVVSTTVGAEGIAAVPGQHLHIADTAESFANAVGALLASPPEWRRMARAGRALYEQQHTWHSAWKRLQETGLDNAT